MKPLLILYTAVLLILQTVCPVRAQQPENLQVPGELVRAYEESINRKLEKYETQVQRVTEQFLGKLQRKINALHAKTIGKGNPRPEYVMFNKANGYLAELPVKDFDPYFDTLACSIGLLNSLAGEGNNTLNALMERVNRQYGPGFVQQFQQQLQQQQQQLLQQYAQYPKAVQQCISAINKEYAVFTGKFDHYRSLLLSPAKAEEKLMGLLRQWPAFNRFMEKNSAIAGLFRFSSAGEQSLAGLQTRELLNGMLKEKTTSANPSVLAGFNGQLQAAQSVLGELKNIIPGGSGNAGELEMYSPRTLKSKTFLQRVELGANIRLIRATSFFPTRSELQLQAGFKFSNKGSVGLGITHWLGWGESIRKVSFTHQGTGYHSWLKMQFGKNLFVNGGWEQLNYHSTAGQMGNVTAVQWKNSALLGIGKRFGSGKSLLGPKWGIGRKRTNEITLLYDFLYKQRTPVTEAFKMRIGVQF